MNPENILIADDFHQTLMDKLNSISVPFQYRPAITREEIKEELAKGITGLVLRSKTPVDKDLLNHQTALKFVARGGAGLDNIDSEFATKLGVECINAGNANSLSVAEHTLGMLLSLLHRLHSADAEIRSGEWNRSGNRGSELSGKTIGIIGYGNAGSAFARLLRGFDVHIIAYDKYKKGFSNDRVSEVSTNDIFREADIVTLHLPLDSQTKLMVNSDFLQSFVRKIILLNTSRGLIVNTIDVLNALENGKILGFGADVLEQENLHQMSVSGQNWFNGLIGRKDVLLTPHVAGWTSESYRRISEILGDKIIRKLAVQKEI